MRKLKKDTDLAKFLIAVKACKNDVFFDSNEGDILNLASTLSQYVFLLHCRKRKYIGKRLCPLCK